uniref:Uncharacterized protein n=1 Tax=Oryza brachyantha TaxID=4533 RepID=J3L9C4_ORYBR
MCFLAQLFVQCNVFFGSIVCSVQCVFWLNCLQHDIEICSIQCDLAQLFSLYSMSAEPVKLYSET